jgi:hypothetical protein
MHRCQYLLQKSFGIRGVMHAGALHLSMLTIQNLPREGNESTTGDVGTCGGKIA